jgi:hypothetical protein
MALLLRLYAWCTDRIPEILVKKILGKKESFDLAVSTAYRQGRLQGGADRWREQLRQKRHKRENHIASKMRDKIFVVA